MSRPRPSGPSFQPRPRQAKDPVLMDSHGLCDRVLPAAPASAFTTAALPASEAYARLLALIIVAFGGNLVGTVTGLDLGYGPGITMAGALLIGVRRPTEPWRTPAGAALSVAGAVLTTCFFTAKTDPLVDAAWGPRLDVDSLIALTLAE